MAKKILGTIGNIVVGLAKIGMFGYALGAGVTAVAGGVGGLFLAGLEAGCVVTKAAEAKDDDKEEDKTESEETPQDKVEFTE